MRVALFGGTGFVGSYLVDALIEAGMQPVLLARPGSESRVRHGAHCEIVSGDLSNDGAIVETVNSADAVVFNVGILREFPERGITFDALHNKAAVRVMQAAERAGVQRFILMSANGVKAEGTAYQRSKYAAEQHLVSTDLDWTIFRPSVIFGDPRGRMEFATQLARDIVTSPLPAPLFFDGLMLRDAGQFHLSPVHVEDVAMCFVASLDTAEAFREILPLGGPKVLSWRAILSTIADALGRTKLMVPVPALGVSAIAAMLDRFESFPVTRDQLQMLMEGNTCGDGAFSLFGIEPRAFEASQLAYLSEAIKGSETCLKNAA